MARNNVGETGLGRRRSHHRDHRELDMKRIQDLYYVLLRKLLGPGLPHETEGTGQSAVLLSRVGLLEDRVHHLEDRLMSYYRNRWDAIDNLADYLVGAEVPGDYVEFGVYKGVTFGYALKIMSSLFPKMKFIAFDSFEGLPEPKGIDRTEDYSSNFYKGQFACSESEFMALLAQQNVDLQKVVTVKGWFHDVLKDHLSENLGPDVIAAAWIDCDLYESTVPVLDFIGPRLSTGSVLLFDDWGCFRNLPDFGQQRACSEWLVANPHITLDPLFPFAWHGKAFTVRLS